MCKRDHAIRFERAVGLVLAALLSACSGGGGAPALPGAASTPSPALGSGLPAAPAPPATTGALDLTVANAYVDQGQQTASGSIPLVAGRDGYLRVFVVADRPNAVRPTVRVRIFRGGTVIATQLVNAPTASVPMTENDAVWSSSWNAFIPGATIAPGDSLLVDVDPTNAIPESNKSNNRFPADAQPLALNVVSVQPYAVTLVPIVTPVGSGDVSAANAADYLHDVLGAYPIAGSDVALHAPFTVSYAPHSDGTNWDTLLNDVGTLQAADGHANDRHYYGVVRLGYQSGVVGIGWQPGMTALGPDDAAPVYVSEAAHEEGHNFGLMHAPCGNPPDVDPNWPADPAHANAMIGGIGLDVANHQVHAASEPDFMSYCNGKWTSDFNYRKVLQALQTTTSAAVARRAAAAEPTLFVTGRIENGRAELDTAFRLTTAPTVPTPGPYHLIGLDANGATLFDRAFDGTPAAVDGAAPGERLFGIAVALDPARAVARLLIHQPDGSTLERRRSLAVGPSAMTGAAVRMAGSSARLTWDATRYPAALVRDARSGAVLGILRGGSGAVAGGGNGLDVQFSDGVDSVYQHVNL